MFESHGASGHVQSCMRITMKSWVLFNVPLLDAPRNPWATIMRIDEKRGTEYETEGVSHCRAGRLATRPVAHFQRSRLVTLSV